MILTGVLWLAAAVLAVAGVKKLAAPSATVAALAAVGIRAGGWTVRLVGVGEVAIGAYVLIVPGPVSARWLAIAYGLFTIYAAVALFRQSDAPCGCFGEVETPVSVFHLVFDLGATLTAVMVSLGVVDVTAVFPLSGDGVVLASAVTAATVSVVIRMAHPSQAAARW